MSDNSNQKKGGKGKIHEHPNWNSAGFHKNPQNINRKGQPKKIYTKLKDKGYSKADGMEAMRQLIFHRDNELKDIFQDPNQPWLTRFIAGQLHKAIVKKDYSAVREIMEYVFGKPLQQMEGSFTANVNSMVDLLLSEAKDKQDGNI